MGFLPFVHFFNLLICLYLAGYVLVKNPKSSMHKVLSALLACFCIWSFGKIFTNNPNTSKDTVNLFVKTGCLGWCSFGSFFLWFSLIFTKKKKILKIKSFYILIFILPVLFIYKQWTNSLIVDSIKQYFGWSFVWAKTIWPFLFFLYYFSFVGIGFYLIFIFGKKTENKTKKKQAKIILTTAIIALFIGTLTDVILLKSGIYKIPPVGDIVVSIWALGLAYSITKYEFLITPATAANNIISTMADSLILLDQKGSIVDVNRATLDLLGYEKNELIGKSARIFLVKKNFNESLLERIIKEDIIDNYELILESKDGENIPVIFSSSALKDELGNTAGVVCTARDITERNRRKEELKKAKDELEIQAQELIKANEETKSLYKEIEKKNKELMELDEMKSEFLSMVSHEIRTPLSIMKQFVSILSDRIPGKVNKLQKEYLDIVHNNINRLGLIVNDLLDISKLESGKMKLSLKMTDISSSIKNTIVSFEAKAKPKGIDLITSLPEELPEVFLDSNRITQVLINLIANALKFTPEKGKITIKVQVKDKFLEVSVTDTGPGIAPGNLDKVFDRFIQLGQNSGPAAQGTGLGLSIAKKIIELHGGRIWVESPAAPEDNGSRFIFLLPLKA